MTERKQLLQWSVEDYQRWSSMPRLSLVAVPRTKFLFLKTPLSTVYEEKYGDRNVFTVSMYVHRLIAKNIDVGLVIDCSALDSWCEMKDRNELETTAPSVGNNHDSDGWYFYNYEDWDDFGIEFIKLGVSSDGKVSSEVLQKFMNICQEHFKKHSNLHIALIDIRGGHGLAAFLAAYYLCHKLKAPVHIALECVKTAVPFKDPELLGCFDMQLVKLLQETFSGRQELVMNLDKLPDWWYRKSDICSLEKNTRGVVKIPPFTKRGTSNVDQDQFNTKASKQKVGDESSKLLEVLSPESPRFKRVSTVMHQMTSESFSTTIPIKTLKYFNVSDDISKINTTFKVTWRSVGRSGLLLILSDGIYFLENCSDDPSAPLVISMITCPMYFPNPQKPSELQHRTILDVTLVTDKEGENNVPRFYIHDILVHMGGILLKKPFDSRIKYLFEGIILPRKKTTAIWNYNKEVIRVRAQEYFDIRKAAFVASEVIPVQIHDADGIILVRGDGEYLNRAILVKLENGRLPKDLIERIDTLHD